MRWSAFDAPCHEDEPYPWVGFDGVLDPADRARLLDELPAEGFVERVDDDGRYALAVCLLLSDGGLGTVGLDAVSPRWRALTATLAGQGYPSRHGARDGRRPR